MDKIKRSTVNLSQATWWPNPTAR